MAPKVCAFKNLVDQDIHQGHIDHPSLEEIKRNSFYTSNFNYQLFFETKKKKKKRIQLDTYNIFVEIRSLYFHEHMA